MMTTGLFIPAVHAEDQSLTIDLTTFTCHEYLRSIKEGHDDEMFKLAAWLDGYMASISADTHVNWADVKKYSQELTAYCRKDGNSVLMDAARKAGIL